MDTLDLFGFLKVSKDFRFIYLGVDKKGKKTNEKAGYLIRGDIGVIKDGINFFIGKKKKEKGGEDWEREGFEMCYNSPSKNWRPLNEAYGLVNDRNVFNLITLWCKATVDVIRIISVSGIEQFLPSEKERERVVIEEILRSAERVGRDNYATLGASDIRRLAIKNRSRFEDHPEAVGRANSVMFTGAIMAKVIELNMFAFSKTELDSLGLANRGAFIEPESVAIANRITAEKIVKPLLEDEESLMLLDKTLANLIIGSYRDEKINMAICLFRGNQLNTIDDDLEKKIEHLVEQLRFMYPNVIDNKGEILEIIRMVGLLCREGFGRFKTSHEVEFLAFAAIHFFNIGADAIEHLESLLPNDSDLREKVSQEIQKILCSRKDTTL